MLKAALGTDAAAVEDAWNSFRANLPEGQERHPEKRLLPLAYRNRVALGASSNRAGVLAYASSLGFNLKILRGVGAALRVLREASIPTIALKGTALSVAIYKDLGVRPMSDGDIWVPSERVHEAIRALLAAGWQGTDQWLASEMHAGNFSNTDGVNVDLHRHVTYEARFADADAQFLERSVPLEVEGEATRRLSDSDQLVHTLVHGLRWSIAPSAVWVADATRLLQKGCVDAAAVALVARRLRFVEPTRAGLAIVRAYAPSDVIGKIEAIQEAISPSPYGERIENHFRVREPAGVLGALPNLWFAYRRSRQPSPQAASFPDFLTRVWGLKSKRDLARALWKKTIARVS